MANSIALSERYDKVLDDVYKEASKTDVLESNQVKFDNTKTVKILKVEVPELGDYSRNSGFMIGDVTATWEAWTLGEDRGREFSIDAMDNDETLDQTFGAASGEFIRTKVVPEIDMYRFAKIAGTSGVSGTSGALSTGALVEGAIVTVTTGKTGTTGSAGGCSINGVLDGTYTVTVTADGFEDYSGSITVDSTHTSFNISLTAAAVQTEP